MQLIVRLPPNQFKQLLSCRVNKAFPTRLPSSPLSHALIPGSRKTERFLTSSYCKLLQLQRLPGITAELHKPGF